MIPLLGALKASYKVDRLFLPNTSTVLFKKRNSADTGWDTLYTLHMNASTGHWSIMEKNEAWNNQSKTHKYLVLSIIDDTWVKGILDQTEIVSYQRRDYKFSREHEPLDGSEPFWELKLELMQWQ